LAKQWQFGSFVFREKTWERAAARRAEYLVNINECQAMWTAAEIGSAACARKFRH